MALGDVHADPDRLRQPMRRTAGGWQAVSWDEALDEAAERLRAVQRAHGRDAVAVYQGNPTVHNYGSLLYAPGFIRALGTRNRFSATSVDQLPHHLAAYYMFGHQLLIPIPDLDRTDFFLVLGANPAVSNGSLMSAPDAAGRIKAIRRRGGTVVVIDPRRTETAALADRHHFIRPGTDALLLLALLHVIFAEGLEKPGRLADVTEGLDGGARRRRRVPAGARGGGDGDRGGGDPRAGACLCGGAQRGVLRALRGEHAGVRRAGALADQPAQPGHRQPGPARRGDVHAPRGGRAEADAARQPRAVQEPGARAAGVRRGAAGGHAGGGDPDARRPDRCARW